MRTGSACFNLGVIRAVLRAGLGVLCLGCSNVLGADFDPDEADGRKLSVTLAEHPDDAFNAIPFTGSGRVISEDAEIDCGSDCSLTLPLGSKDVVKLTALPDDGSAFAGWHATACPNSRATSCTVGPLERNETIEAYFVKNGANLWQLSVDEAGINPQAAIAVGDAGDAYALGSFEGALTLPGIQLSNEGELDLFLLHLDATGELVNDPSDVSARSVATEFSEFARGLAISSTGPVMIATTSVEKGVEVEVSPLGQFVMGTSDGVVVGFDENLGVRWSQVTHGDGDQTFDFVAVDAADRTYVLGTSVGPVEIGIQKLEVVEDVDIILARFDADGSLDWLDNLHGSTPLGLATLHQALDLLVAGFEPSSEGLFKSCPKAQFVDGEYVIRINALDGFCSDLLSFPSQFHLVQLLTTEDDHVIVIGSLNDGVLDFDPSDPKAHVAIGPSNSYVIVSLDSHLQWVPDESWIQVVKGASKFGAAGVGNELVLSFSAKTDTFVGDQVVPYQSPRGMIFIALGLDGQLLWHRSFGDVYGGVANQIAWNAIGSSWYFAGMVQVDQPSLLDLANVTQPPIPLHDRQALFGRFAP